MWIVLAIVSSVSLGVYDIFKKLSLTGNDVLKVLLLNTLFGTMLMSPVLYSGIADGSWGFGAPSNHLYIVLKSVIVLSSWTMGYYAVKHLPITITGPINATRPIMVLVGALLVFGERLNLLQWLGVIIGFSSLFFISRIGAKEGFSLKSSRWLWLMLGATIMGAVSALYDKYLLTMFKPLAVQAWYSLYQLIIMAVIVLVIGKRDKDAAKFQWRWTIPFISVFLTAADLAYFYCLSLDGSMISVVSMIRRGSVIVSFLFGIVVLKEKDVKLKLIDLTVLIIGLVLLIIGSR